MIEICNENNVYMKEHNADYLTNDSLSWHPKLEYMLQMCSGIWSC